MQFLLKICMLIVAGALLAGAQVDVKKKVEAAKEKAAVQLDINTASVDQLRMLPGIGDAYSKKIVDGRPYARKDELVQKKILPEGVYEKIKDSIVARQATKKK